MKIIKEPEIKNWSTQVTCRCTAVLEIDVKDITSSFYDGSGSYQDPPYYSYSVKCPICKDSVSVNDSKMTDAVKIHLQKNANNPANFSLWDR